jgi:hypothetical protein
VAGQQLIFEGLKVLGHDLKLKGKVEVTSTEPINHGTEVFVIVRAKVVGVSFTDDEDYGALIREHVAKVEAVALLPESVSPAIVFAEAKETVERVREQARQSEGQQAFEGS